MTGAVLCFGDSNTWGASPFGAGRQAERWPVLLCAHLAPHGIGVIEEGLRGRTTDIDDPAMLGRSGAAWLLPCLISHQPVDTLVIQLGVNDLKDRYARSVPDVVVALERLVALARALPCEGPDDRLPRVVLIAPPPLGPRDAAFAPAYRQADAKSAALGPAVVEAAARLGVDCVDARAILPAAGGDGVHLGPEGHRALAALVAARIIGADPGRAGT